jgi:hypothetical protein
MTTHSRQEQNALQREQQQQLQQEHLARLVANHQQQKQHLLRLLQQQSVAAQQHKIQSVLLLQQLAAMAQRQRQLIESKLPRARAMAREYGAARIPHGVNVVEDDSFEEPSGSFSATTTTKHQADLAPQKGIEPVVAVVLQEPAKSVAVLRSSPQQGPQGILKEKPMKPLSAYNFSFRGQRAILAEELDSKEGVDIDSSITLSSSDDKDQSFNISSNKRKRNVVDKKSASAPSRKKTLSGHGGQGWAAKL